MDNTYQIIHLAMRELSARCDGAQAKDGMGFNGLDTKFGHRVANMALDELTSDIVAECARILPIYAKQLAAYGVDMAALKAACKEFDGIDNRHSARDQARQNEYAKKHAPYISVKDGIVKVFNSYEIRGDLAGNGFTFIRPTKSWDASLTALTAATILGIGKINLDDDQRLSLEDLASQVNPADVPAKPVNVTLGNDGRLVMQTSFNQVPLSVTRALPGRIWDGQKRVNYIDAHIAVLKVIEEYELTISDEALAAIESNRAANEAAIAKARESFKDSIATDTDDTDIALLDSLYPFQRAGVAYAKTHGNTLIADEMGLGKTRQALSYAETVSAYPLIVVCPASLKLNWAREIKALLPHRSIKIVDGRYIPETTSTYGITHSDIVIINYNVLESWLDVMPAFKAAIVDESHYVKNLKAQRTKSVLVLCKSVNDRGGKVVFLTGTPILNRPVELVAQLVALGYLRESETKQRGSWKIEGTVPWFLYKFCGPEKNRWGTTFQGSSNEIELNEWLRTHCMIRRTKADVLTELPAKTRAPQFIGLSESAESLYLQLAEEGAERAAESRAQAIVYLNALRVAIGDAKIQQAIEWINDFLETGKSLVVFADHVKVQKALFKAMTDAGHNPAAIVAGMKTDTIESEKARFQAKETPVIILSFGAAREGHTLTAASDVLFVELGWNPGTHNQAEDRSHRIGQDLPVTAWYIVAQETIDEWTYELIESKRKIVNAVSDGRLGADDEESIFSQVLDRALSTYGHTTRKF